MVGEAWQHVLGHVDMLGSWAGAIHFVQRNFHSHYSCFLRNLIFVLIFCLSFPEKTYPDPLHVISMYEFSGA